MPAIQTIGERGIQFRSRIEAKWARMFELLRWPWEYEPIDLNGYIPDFVLTFPRGPVLVEVKSDLYLDDLEQYEQKIDDSGWEGDAIIVGGCVFQWKHHPSFGLMSHKGRWSQSVLFTCRVCGKHAIAGVDTSPHCRHNGCGDDSTRHFGLFAHRNDPMATAQALWSNACNLTQWTPKSASDWPSFRAGKDGA